MLSVQEALGRLQRVKGDLRWTVEAEGKSDGADAAVDVELHPSELEVSHDVFLAHGGKNEWAVEGHAHLSSVGVAGEHEVDELAARVCGDGVGVIGFVDHEDDGTVGFGGDGQVEVGVAGSRIVSTAKPYS